MGLSTISSSFSAAASRGRDTTRMPLASRAQIVRSMIGLLQKGSSCCRAGPDGFNGRPAFLANFSWFASLLSAARPATMTRTLASSNSTRRDPMSGLSRRQLLATFLGGLAQATGAVVLARAVLSETEAQGNETSTSASSQADVQERADQLVAGQGPPDEEDLQTEQFV